MDVYPSDIQELLSVVGDEANMERGGGQHDPTRRTNPFNGANIAEGHDTPAAAGNGSIPRLVFRDGGNDQSSDDELLGGCGDVGDVGQTNTAMSDVRRSHCHPPRPKHIDRRARNQLIVASMLCLVFMVAEALGGYFSGSLAIMTDAAHMLSDFGSFLISLFAVWVARRPATKRMSFGYYRAEVLGAVVSVLVIWVLTGVLVYMAFERVVSGEFEIDADVMLVTSGCGVAVNIFMGLVLHGICGCHTHAHAGAGHHNHRGSSASSENGHGGTKMRTRSNSFSFIQSDVQNKTDNINVRAALIHVLGDLVQSIGVLIAAYIIKYKPDYKMADPICTFVFSVIVLCTTLTILRDAVGILMEATPKDVNYNSIKEDLLSISGVKMMHSLHVWALTVEKNALAVHLAVDSAVDEQSVLQSASKILHINHNIQHMTIQVEHYNHHWMSSCEECIGPKK